MLKKMLTRPRAGVGLALVAVLGAWGATATAATGGSAQGTLAVTPASLAAGASTSLTTAMGFSYGDSRGGEQGCESRLQAGSACDQLSAASVAYAPGLSLNPAAATAVCTAAQLSAYNCPAASQIGSGAASFYTYDTPADGTYGSVTNAPFRVFETTSPVASRSGIAIVDYVAGNPVLTIRGTLGAGTTGAVLALTSVPRTATLFGVSELLQFTSLNVAWPASVDGHVFERNPSKCVAAVSRLAFTSTLTPMPPISSSSFTPTGC